MENYLYRRFSSETNKALVLFRHIIPPIAPHQMSTHQTCLKAFDNVRIPDQIASSTFNHGTNCTIILTHFGQSKI